VIGETTRQFRISAATPRMQECVDRIREALN